MNAETSQVLARLRIKPEECFATSASLYGHSARVRPYLTYVIKSSAARIVMVDEGEGSTPEPWWNRRVLTVPLPGFATGQSLAAWCADAVFLRCLASLDDGTSIEWDGHNFVGVLTEQAAHALESLRAEAREMIAAGHDVRLIETDDLSAEELFPDWAPGDPPVTAADVLASVDWAVDATNVLKPDTDWAELAQSINEALEAR